MDIQGQELLDVFPSLLAYSRFPLKMMDNLVGVFPFKIGD